jgi:ribonucleotide monophosphatase NagD (HAD superfamily)
MTKKDQNPNLNAIHGFLLDMDGTLYLGDQPLPGSHDLIGFLQ